MDDWKNTLEESLKQPAPDAPGHDLNRRGDLAAAEGDWENAERYYDDAARLGNADAWRGAGVLLLRRAGEIAADRPKDKHEKWAPGEPDYDSLIIDILYCPAFEALQWKPSNVSDYRTADDFARQVADLAEHIALKNGYKGGGARPELPYDWDNLCQALAYAAFLGHPPEGIAGAAALQALDGGKYSASGLSLRVLARAARQPVPECFVQSLLELDNEDIELIDSNAARAVWFARRVLEDISLMTEDEKERWGGIVLESCLRGQITLGADGRLEASPVFWEMDKTVRPRHKLYPNPAMVGEEEKSKVKIIPDPIKVEENVGKYEAMISESATEWELIGRLLDIDPRSLEWQEADEVYCQSEEFYSLGDACSAVSRIGEAALMGHPAAQYDLGKLYETGDHGMRPDAERARYWYERAAERGYKDPQRNMAELYYKLRVHSVRVKEDLTYNHTDTDEYVEYYDLNPQSEISAQMSIKIKILDLLYKNGEFAGVTLEKSTPAHNSLVIDRNKRKLLIGETMEAGSTHGNDDFDVSEHCEISIVREEDSN